MTHRLLAFTTDPRPPVRRTTFTLLDRLCPPGSGWPAVTDAAEAALSDGDPVVRRTAAGLLVRAATPDRARAALGAATDPAVRVALVNTMVRRHGLPERLRTDPVPAVRLLATIAAYRADDPAAWPALDAAVHADLEAATGALTAPGLRLPATAGLHWARALTGLDREEDCCSWAERLAGDERTARGGVRMAVEAMRRWRAAPARLTPMLTGLLTSAGHPDVRSAAVHALAASLTATRLAADALAAVLDDTDLGAVAAVALGATGDHRAMPHLVRMLAADSAEPRLIEAFRALARAGADPEAPVTAARRVLAAHPDSHVPELPMWVLITFGSAAAAAVPELLAKLHGAENDTPDLVFYGLGRIGPAAAAAVPELRRYPTSGARYPLLLITMDRAVADRYLSGRPEELRHDRTAAAALTWLAGHGGLTARQHRQLRSLFRTPGSSRMATARALWLHEGPAAAADLLAALPEDLSEDLDTPGLLRVFGEMGVHARPVLDRLDRLVNARHREGFAFHSADAAMRADETLLAAAVDARARIRAALTAPAAARRVRPLVAGPGVEPGDPPL